jgi:hypothetical protein
MNQHFIRSTYSTFAGHSGRIKCGHAEKQDWTTQEYPGETVSACGLWIYWSECDLLGSFETNKICSLFNRIYWIPVEHTWQVRKQSKWKVSHYHFVHYLSIYGNLHMITSAYDGHDISADWFYSLTYDAGHATCKNGYTWLRYIDEQLFPKTLTVTGSQLSRTHWWCCPDAARTVFDELIRGIIDEVSTWVVSTVGLFCRCKTGRVEGNMPNSRVTFTNLSRIEYGFVGVAH